LPCRVHALYPKNDKVILSGTGQSLGSWHSQLDSGYLAGAKFTTIPHHHLLPLPKGLAILSGKKF